MTAASREVSPDELEAVAWHEGATIILPPPSGGWARVVTSDGERLHAWVTAVTSP